MGELHKAYIQRYRNCTDRQYESPRNKTKIRQLYHEVEIAKIWEYLDTLNGDIGAIVKCLPSKDEAEETPDISATPDNRDEALRVAVDALRVIKGRSVERGETWFRAMNALAVLKSMGVEV